MSLAALDKESGKQIKTLLLDQIKRKKLSQEQAEAILALDIPPEETPAPGGKSKAAIDFDKEWTELTHELDPNTRQKIKAAKIVEDKELKAIDAEMKEALHDFREITNAMSQQVLDQADREKTIRNLSLATGLPIKEKQVFVCLNVFTDPKTNEIKKIKQYTTIQKIGFEEIEQVDENGNPTGKKISTGQPVIEAVSVDPITNTNKIDKFSYANFIHWVEEFGVTEDVKSMQDLETSIGTKVKKGDTFEFRYDPTTGNPKDAQNIVVTVRDIVDGTDEYGEPTKKVVLDQPVNVSPRDKRNELTMAEFARWFKREEVMRPIESLDKLKDELRLHNQYLNEIYQRDQAHYPPIEAKPGEVLKYDDKSGKSFVIKEADDKHILLDSGDPPMTLASFLRWVKKNEVEKKDPAAEAEQIVSNMPDGDAKDEEKARLENEKRQENAVRLEDSKDPKKSGIHGHSNDPSQYSTSYLRKLWMNTNFLSLKSFWEMGKTIYDFIKRKLDRREKGTVGVVGEQIFGGLYPELGGEYKSLAQSAENEEVEHHAKVYRTMGIEAVKHHLYESPNKDILKACITVLCEKGQMRWDDEGFRRAMNKLANGSPAWVRPENHLEGIEKILDGWFGQDTFREFRNKQESSYNSVKKNFEDNAKRLEVDPNNNGGLRFALKNLMFKHLRGEYVNPAEYEEYLYYAIQAGKLDFEDKFYYLVMGIGAQAPGHHGMTLLHIDRVGSIESELMNQFPLIDYFVDLFGFEQYDVHGNPLIDPKTGKQKMGKPQIHHFKQWISDYCEKDLKGSIKNIKSPNDLGPKDSFQQFVREEVVWNKNARTRLEKSVGDCKRWDHDDMDFFGPLLGDETIINICQKQGGSQQMVSTVGLKNTYVGFNRYMNIKMGMLKRHLAAGGKEDAEKDVRDLTNIMRSFIRFDAVIDNRWNHGQPAFSRFGDQEYNSTSIADNKFTVRQHQQEMYAFIKGIAQMCDQKLNSNLADKWENKIIKKYGFQPPGNIAQEQMNAISEYGKEIEGALSALSPEQIMDLMAEVKNQNAAEDKIVSRQMEEGERLKGQGEQVRSELVPYRMEDIIDKVSQIDQLNEELVKIGSKKPEEIEKEKSAKLQKLLDAVRSGRTSGFEKKDGAILDAEIQRLQGEIAKKERGEPAERGQPGEKPAERGGTAERGHPAKGREKPQKGR
jgi:hypothetical protein